MTLTASISARRRHGTGARTYNAQVVQRNAGFLDTCQDAWDGFVRAQGEKTRALPAVYENQASSRNR